MRIYALASICALALVPLIGATGPARSTFNLFAAPLGAVGSGWTMPWQLSPASDASRAQGEVTVLGYVPGYGTVRGTPTALRYLFSALPDQPGRNSLVEACQASVGRAAAKFGRVRVEASSAGPERRTPDGTVAPVSFRLTYSRFNGREDYEVRQTTLTCAADRGGRIVNASA
ncbi:hypothetical protein Q8W71_31540 [Methylobacterium sp. NEAU 140]|uniref:hypothetical protein n=1 Tax=Methylobacterium sp. NEAU 140 TaxID=3064945 RepID=UPI002734C189|nr:hypothetical protein [Methylobacterium sp. NEAU 140]MDP4027119.1 hypothetical protein [Methylobacterium sp. NEAU 140]